MSPKNAAAARSPAPGAARPKARRDAAWSRRAILDAALVAFSESGHAGARIDDIAERAGVSKPLIYKYFGDKDQLYAAALREAYVQIREGERQLNLENREPEEAIRALVHFTMDHFRAKPWFISMLNTENMRGGQTVREIADVGAIQSRLIEELRKVLARGIESGCFRAGLDPVELYITIASLCYFPISNKHTLRVVFGVAVDDAWLERRKQDASEQVIRYLKPL